MTAGSYVYFIQAGPGGPIKIGLAADPQDRLIDLQIGNPADLTLLAVIPGSLDAERALHERFAAGRIRGEWFSPETAGLSEAILRAVHVESHSALGYRGQCSECGLPLGAYRKQTCGDTCSTVRKRRTTSAWKSRNK